MMRTLLLALVLLTTAAYAAPAPTTITHGDWQATLSDGGVAISYRGVVLSSGSYLHVFKPEYKGNVIGLVEAWKQGTLTVAPDGHSLSLAADLPAGHFGYDVALDGNGVRMTATIDLVADAQVGPVEYPLAQMPAEIVKDATLEITNVAGLVVSSQPLPSPPKPGGLAPSGPALTVRTPERTIVVECLDSGTVYPFDSRAERYGNRQGLWAFSSPGLSPGFRNVLTCVLRVEPPTPPRPQGALKFGNGSAVTGLVTGRDVTKREALAVSELASYLEKMTAVKLPCRETALRQAPAGSIVVGNAAVAMGLIKQSELQAVQPDGYVVKVRDGRAAVCGWRDVGTLYGAYALLRRLGCRFYAPSCEIVPQVTALTLPDCTLSDKPCYEFRNVSGNAKLGQTLNNDLMSPAEIGEKGNIVHASEYLVPFDKYHEEHPEYFALQKNGKRLTREGDPESFNVHLCLSNPDVRRLSAERMLAIMDKQADRKFFGVSQGDGFAWCECEQCKALDSAPGVMTDRLLDYVNYIARECAKKYPDKRILTLAYTDATSPPPTRVLPEPNVMVQYCPYPHRTACQSHDLTCEKNTQGLADLKGWFEKCPRNMYIFDYPTGYQNWWEPFGSFWAMKSKLDFYAANGVRGLFYCGTPRNFQDLFIYVQSELLWHPNTPVEPLIREFMDVYYGPAAPAVRRYFDFMAKEFKERPIHQMCEGASPHTVTAAYADTALGMLGEAEAAVKNDRARLYRVRAEKLCVLFGDVNARNPVNNKLEISEDLFARRLAEFCGIVRSMRLGGMIRRVEMDDWLYRIARLKATRRPWYSDPVIDRLIADPLPTLTKERQAYTQSAVPGGLRLELDGFRGAKGPQDYAYECPSHRAIWVYGSSSDAPSMWTKFELKTVPAKARLVLTGQDDDKPGAVRLQVTVNGREVFAGANTCAEHNWTAQEITVPVGVLKEGENELRISTLDPSKADDQGWFMLAECLLLTQ